MFTHTIIEIMSYQFDFFENRHIFNSFDVKMNIAKVNVFVDVFDRIVNNDVFVFVSWIKKFHFWRISFDVANIFEWFCWIWKFDWILRFWLYIISNIFDQNLKNLSLLLKKFSILLIVIFVKHFCNRFRDKFSVFCVSWCEIWRNYRTISTLKKNDDEITWNRRFNRSRKCERKIIKRVIEIVSLEIEMNVVNWSLIQSR